MKHTRLRVPAAIVGASALALTAISAQAQTTGVAAWELRLGGNDWQYAFSTNIWNDPLHAACQ